MAKKSLISKMLNKLLPIENETVEQDLYFYIPETSTLTALKLHQKFDVGQVYDYLNYIMSNYYLSYQDSEILADFASEWAIQARTVQSFNNRREQATSKIVNQLINNGRINIIDALWVSDKIFVDNAIKDRKLIITKTIDNQPDLVIEINRYNPKIAIQIEKLKDELKSATLSKTLDIN